MPEELMQEELIEETVTLPKSEWDFINGKLAELTDVMLKGNHNAEQFKGSLFENQRNARRLEGQAKQIVEDLIGIPWNFTQRMV